MPQGVANSPSKFQRLMEWWMGDLHLKEVLVFLGDMIMLSSSLEEHERRLLRVLNRLKEYGLKTQASNKLHCSSNQPFGKRWNQGCQQAFATLIEQFSSTPVLRFAGPALPYILHTDASTTGLGAALYQEQDGKLWVVAFASLGLSQSESRYPSTK